jgi:hypothetical protein
MRTAILFLQQDTETMHDRSDVYVVYVGGGGVEGLKLKDGFRSFDHLKRDPTAPLPAQLSAPPSCFRPGPTRTTAHPTQESTPKTVSMRWRKGYSGSGRFSKSISLPCKARRQHCGISKRLRRSHEWDAHTLASAPADKTPEKEDTTLRNKESQI